MEKQPNSKTLYEVAAKQLKPLYGADEGEAIAFMIVEKTTHLSKTQILAEQPVLQRHFESFERALNRVARMEPVQYVLGEAHFHGHSFHVNPSVLIPRPETEMLVDEVISLSDKFQQPMRVLDVCTGSGCIAIAIKKSLPDAAVTAVDISMEALGIAQFNAQRLNADVTWRKVNVLKDAVEESYDIIVSNPPYIPLHEKATMPANVTRYEPGLALFVPDEDPFIFYRSLAQMATRCLTEHGKLVAEIHEQAADEVKQVLLDEGLTQVEIKKDFAGKYRMIVGQK